MRDLDASAARKLFRHHAFDRLDVESLPVPWSDVHEVIEICGGLPLALEVVASHLRFDSNSENHEDWKARWKRAVRALESWKSVEGKNEDRLQRCLEFSYDSLSKELQQAFLDIAVCFNGSPWNELRIMYAAWLPMLKEKALIKEGTAFTEGEKYSYVKIHALLSSLARQRGRMAGSHFIETVDVSNKEFSDIPSHQDCGKDRIALVLQGHHQPSRVEVSPSAWMVFKSIIFNFIYHDLQQRAVDVVSLPVSRLSRFARSLRILVLTNVKVEGTFASVVFPQHLELFACLNSTVPFSRGNFCGLENLVVVDVTTTIDRNSTFSFAPALQRLRLESPCIETLRLGAGVSSLKEFALISSNSFNAQNGGFRLPQLRKLIIRNISCSTELPSMFRNVSSSLESLSIQGCDNLKQLPDGLDHLWPKLKYLHISLKQMEALPDSISMMANLESLTLEDCYSLETLPAGITGTRTLKVLAIRGCPKLKYPEGLLSAFRADERNDRLVLYSDDVKDIDKLEQEAATERQMHSVTLKPTNRGSARRVSDSLYELYRPAEGEPTLQMIFFHGLIHQTEHQHDAYCQNWMTADNSECWLMTWLCETFPQSHILSVSYDSAVPMSDYGGRMDPFLIGETLLQSLLFCRRTGAGRRCPVLLVGQGFGGLVLKRMCIEADERRRRLYSEDGLSSFINNISGIFLFDTPHIHTHMEFKGLPSWVFQINAEHARLNEVFLQLGRLHRWVEEQFLFAPVEGHFPYYRPENKRSDGYRHLVTFVQKVLLKQGIFHRTRWHAGKAGAKDEIEVID